MSHPLDPEATRLAATTQFAKSEGGRFIVMPESALASWNGGTEVNGVVDSERVGAGFTLIECRNDQGAHARDARRQCVLAAERWHADRAVDQRRRCRDPADGRARGHRRQADRGRRRLPPSRRQRRDVRRGVCRRGRREGSDLDRSELPEGNYAVRMCVEWRGRVTGTDDKPHDVMVQVLNLRLRQ